MNGMKHGDKIVYSPYNGSLYYGRGAIAENDFEKPFDFIGIKKIGHMTETVKEFNASVQNIKSAPGAIKYRDYKLTYAASAKDDLKKLVARKRLQASIQENGYTAKGLLAAQQLAQMDAAIGGVGLDEVSPIRVIPLIRKILGVRPNIFFVEQGWTTVNVAKLDARVPEQDTRTGQVQMNPLEKIDFDKLKFAEDRFNLKKNAHATLLPSETSKRADFNVMQLNSTDAMVSFARMRNGQGLKGLSEGDGTLVDKDAPSATFSISDPDASAVVTGVPHADFNIKRELLDQFQDFLNSNEALVDVTYWNPIDYARYEANYFTHGKLDVGGAVTVSGVLQLAGIPDVAAILDRRVPRGMFYAASSQGTLKGEGPFETEFWREYTRDADAFVMRDYIQFLPVNPNRYIRKVQIDATTASGDEFDPAVLDEIDTDAKLDTYVRGATGLLNKVAT
ncbi:hypothetical protein LCGC14_0380350 [marine sediment metagenome]|uniref:Uncharacterized protein n=1 Tax=marine sediment metagenome TaxID=412755 RepID=A0A0F9T8B6_9ZZZZ